MATKINIWISPIIIISSFFIFLIILILFFKILIILLRFFLFFYKDTFSYFASSTKLFIMWFLHIWSSLIFFSLKILNIEFESSGYCETKFLWNSINFIFICSNISNFFTFFAILTVSSHNYFQINISLSGSRLFLWLNFLY
jgi:hypothetical protein